MSSKAEPKKIKIRLKKSSIGTHPNHKATVRALGLRKIGQSRELPANSAVLGMIRSVDYLLAIEN